MLLMKLVGASGLFEGSKLLPSVSLQGWVFPSAPLVQERGSGTNHMVLDREPPSFPATGVLPPGPACRMRSVLRDARKPSGLNLGLLFAALTKLRHHLQVRSTLDLVLPARVLCGGPDLGGNASSHWEAGGGRPLLQAPLHQLWWHLGGGPLEGASAEGWA